MKEIRRFMENKDRNLKFKSIPPTLESNSLNISKISTTNKTNLSSLLNSNKQIAQHSEFQANININKGFSFIILIIFRLNFSFLNLKFKGKLKTQKSDTKESAIKLYIEKALESKLKHLNKMPTGLEDAY